jgi:hypothetical protein
MYIFDQIFNVCSSLPKLTTSGKTGFPCWVLGDCKTTRVPALGENGEEEDVLNLNHFLALRDTNMG